MIESHGKDRRCQLEAPGFSRENPESRLPLSIWTEADETRLDKLKSVEATRKFIAEYTTLHQ